MLVSSSSPSRQCRWCGVVASKVSAEEIFDTVIRITAHDKFYSQLTPKCPIKCADAQYCITPDRGTGKGEYSRHLGYSDNLFLIYLLKFNIVL